MSNIVVLRYHSVHEDVEKYDKIIGKSIIHSPIVFKEQMEIVARKFFPITMDDLVKYFNKEEKIPQNAVIITFDDGYYDNYHYAAPILNSYGLKATFYISVNSIDGKNPPWFVRLRHSFFSTDISRWNSGKNKKNFILEGQENRNMAYVYACRECARLNKEQQSKYVNEIEKELQITPLEDENLMLSWAQVRELAEMGHIIGSHTISHPNLAYLHKQDIVAEVKDSKLQIEKKIKRNIVHFSYTNPALSPNFNDRTRNIVRETGYLTAVTSNPGPAKISDDILMLRRMWVPEQKNSFLWYLNSTLMGRTL